MNPNGARGNTVYLSGDDGDAVVGCPGWLGRVAVLGALDVPAAHFAFDQARVGAQSALGESLGEDLADCLLMCCGGRRAARG